MRKLYTIILISLLAASSRADDLASSFKDAACLAEAQNKEPARQTYLQRDLKPYYLQKYGPIFQSCLKSTDRPDRSTFSFVAAIGEDGRVLRVYVDHETNLFACVRQTMQQDEFPHPPVSPFYWHLSMSFQ